MKTRVAEESNYKSIYLDSGKTIRIAINPYMDITELEYPEFYDIKITSNCEGNCTKCYMNSNETDLHYENSVEKLRNFFNSIPEEHLPYQIAYGGGEPTSSPEFNDIMKMTKEEFNIIPNFTTNGMWALKFSKEEINKHLEVVKKYCGGVAVSCHDHLKKYWTTASNLYLENNIRLNFHIIISDKESIDEFIEIYNEWKDKVEYFVLLPYTNVGRAKNNPKDINWEYFKENFKKIDNKSKIAFGANFYPYLKNNELDVKISLYEPEILSKFLDLKDGNVYKSSFAVDKPIKNIF